LEKPVIILFFPVFDYGHKGSEYIPYALLHLERVVRANKIRLILIDENVTPDYAAIIEAHKDHLLMAGVSAITGYQIKGGLAFSKTVKSTSPNAKILWGGWHATITPEQTLQTPCIDFIIMGQGEQVFKELCDALISNADFKNIKGLGYKQGNKTYINLPAPFFNTNDYPEIDYSLIDINKYVLKTDFSQRRLMYFASYGCPFDCPFCSGAQVFQKKWFSKKIDTIIADFKYFKKIAHIDSILFWDDNFFSNKKFVLTLAQRLIDENINLVWEGSAHAGGFLNLFDDEDLRLLYKAGCRRVSTGAESGSDIVLKQIKEKLVYTDVLALIEKLKKHNITCFFSTMVGYPFEREKDIENTFNLIRKAKIIDKEVKVQINIYTPYPKTELYAGALEKGFAEPATLEGWINHSPARFKPLWMQSSSYTLIEDFMSFYLPFSEKNAYKRAPDKFQKTAFYLNRFLRPLILLRFKMNFFKMPVESRIFRFFLSRYNKKHKDNFRFYAYGIFGV